jgi:hypothetical protein
LAKATAWIDNGPAYVDEEDLERRKKRKRPRVAPVKRGKRG